MMPTGRTGVGQIRVTLRLSRPAPYQDPDARITSGPEHQERSPDRPNRYTQLVLTAEFNLLLAKRVESIDTLRDRRS